MSQPNQPRAGWRWRRVGELRGAGATTLVRSQELWHIQAMKALKSQLASEVMADPSAREQLRQFITGGGSKEFLFRRPNGETVRIKPTFVPKAKAA